jgi:5'-nucleotidase/UDP-sugar diphosphatase
MRRLLVIFSLTAIVFSAPMTRAAEKKLTIVYTNSLNGYLDYCHCKNDPRGGLVKRATEIKKIQKQYDNTILFETGDFFTYDPDHLLANYVIRGYRHIGYDAVLFGDQEFSIGIEKFLQHRKDLPFVCNNLLIKKGSWRRFFKRYRIIKRGGLRIGVIGTIASDVFRYYPRTLTKRLKILDQVQAIKHDIDTLRKRGVDIIVLLSHSGYERDISLQRELSGIDVIIGGHSQTLVKRPKRWKNAIIVQAGADGAHIGILQLTIDGEKISFSNSFKLPDEFQPADDPYIRSLIREYRNTLKKQMKELRF